MPKFYADVDIKAPALTITNGDAGGEYQPIFTLESTNSTTGNEPLIRFNKNTTGNGSEDVGTIEFIGQDDGSNEQKYGAIKCQASAVADGAERGEIFLMASSGSNHYTAVKGTAASTAGVVDVAIGTNAASTTTIAGDLSITTGLLLDSVDITTIQTSSESFADNDTSLMTSAAIDDRIAANGVTFEIPGNTTGAFQGDVVYFGNTSGMTTGAIYMYTGATNQWVAADATAVADSDGLLAVALGGSSDTNGMLLRGMVVLDMAAGSTGDVVFLSTTPGDVTTTAPSGNNNVVRILGYTIVVANGVGAKIWFNPDNTFVEVTT